jgi:hypothetical protein
MVKINDIKTNFPFISVLNYGDSEYVGIIINQDHNVTTFYDFNIIRTENEKKNFLELGEIWWWESNRLIPINIFLKTEIETFKYCQKSFSTKDVEVILGPTVNLANIASKRIKRKVVQLVRRR